MVTAAIGVRVLRIVNARTLLDQRPVAWTVQAARRRHVIGSVVFGMGWGIAGTCPGPIAAQLGRGQLAAVFTITGVLAGIALHDQMRARRESPVKRNRLPEAVSVAGL